MDALEGFFFTTDHRVSKTVRWSADTEFAISEVGCPQPGGKL